MALTKGANTVDYHATIVVAAGDDRVRLGRNNMAIFRGPRELANLGGIREVVNHRNTITVVHRSGQIAVYDLQHGNVLETAVRKADHCAGLLLESDAVHKRQLNGGLNGAGVNTLSADDLHMLTGRHTDVDRAGPSDLDRPAGGAHHGRGLVSDAALE